MSANPNPPDQPTLSTESLQFERAEFKQGAALPCSFCKAPISGQYYQVTGQTACPNCREQIDSAMAGGSKSLRALRALAAGTAAAIGGFLIYWGVRVVTGYELAIIAILIGFMVGGAVRWGAQIRGGLFYQLMAVVLTYLSIASNYTPDVLQGMRQGETEESEAAATILSTSTADPASTATQPAPPESSPGALPAVAPSEQSEQSIPLWFALPFAFVISLAVPFMGGLNIIGWLIIAFGLMQAWSMNKRVPLQISGPFHTGSTPPQAPLLQT